MASTRLNRSRGIGASLSLIAMGSHAQSLLGCDINDKSCLQQVAESRCSLEGATTASCLSFVESLEQTLDESYTTSLGSTLAMANLLLANTNTPDAAVTAENSGYIDEARTAYQEIIERDPANASAYLGLANIARLEGAEDRIDWLRAAASVSESPFYSQLLATALQNEVGGFEAELEAAQITERLYDREDPGPAKWSTAATVWVKYTSLEMAYPDRLNPPLSASFAERVRDDANLDTAFQLLRDPANAPQEVSAALELTCFEPITGIFGFENCVAGIESSVSAALAVRDARDRDVLSGAAINGMKTAANWRIPFALPDWEAAFDDWIARLLSGGTEDTDVLLELYLARADYVGNSPARIDALSSAVEIAPDNANVHLKLGTAYLDQRMWQEAREHLMIARRLSPTEDYPRIDRFLQTVADELSDGN